ncbi:MAG: response regulator [Rhodospirillaceae bacterium]
MGKILVIDDDDMVRDLLMETLRRADYDVDIANNGAEGLKHFEDTRYDLVVTDILMPEKEGIETIMAMRKSDPATRVLAISGGGRTGNHDYLDIALVLGATAVLRKPFRPSQFLEKVRTLLADEAPGPAESASRHV